MRTIKEGESHSSLESPYCVVVSACFQDLFLLHQFQFSLQCLDGCLPLCLFPSVHFLSLISIFNPSLLLLPQLSYATTPFCLLSLNECIHSFSVYQLPGIVLGTVLADKDTLMKGVVPALKGSW